MSSYTRVRLSTALLLALAAGVAAATAATLHSGSAPAGSGAPVTRAGLVAATAPAAGSEVDLGDPATVCEAFAAALFTVDAADTSPVDAYRRAAAYATPQLGTALAAAPDRWSLDWHRLVARRGGVTVQIGEHAGEPPPGRAGTAHRAVVVTATPAGSGRPAGRASRYIVYCTLHRAGPQWQLAGYQLERRPLP